MKYFVHVLFLVTFFAATSFGQFVENKGQVLDKNEDFHPEVKYYHSGSNAGVYFKEDRVVYNFIKVDKVDKDLYADNKEAFREAMSKREAVYSRMDLVFKDANPSINISAGDQSQGVTHFYLNKRNGIRDVRTFKSIKYNNVYPNIDVVFHSSQRGMKYDIVLKEEANIEDVRLDFEGSNVKIIDKKLVIPTKFGDITEEIPLSFINDDSENKVDVEYILNEDGTVGFKLNDQVDYSKLTIDPVLEWASYFNQTIDPSGFFPRLDYLNNHMDDDGNYFTYGLGYSGSSNYPIVNPGGAYTDVYDNSSDLYIVKFNTDRQLVWGTYLGGSGNDQNYWGKAMTSFGNTLHVVGGNMTSGAPFTNGGGFYESVDNRSFWARFNRNTGALEHLTSLSTGDGLSIAVSPLGNVAIVCDIYGFSTSYMPIMNRAGAFNQSVNGGSRDMGLLMFDASYNQIWGTLLGGPSTQEGFTCAFDSNENLYFAGGTNWLSGSTAANERLVSLAGAYNQNIPGGYDEVKFGKFNSNGQLIWHSLYGGNRDDGRVGQMGVPADVIVHPVTDELILAFNTTSTNLPVQNLTGALNQGVPTDPDFGAGGSFWNYAGYIAKFSPAGVRNWGTYFYSDATNSGTYLQTIGFGGCNKFYVGAAGSDNVLTGASGGYNLLTNTSPSRSGYATMLDATSFSFEWDTYMNSDNTLDCYIASNINQARFFTIAPIWNNNSPVVDPGNGAYFEANNWGPTESTLGIYQFHPSFPPDVSNETTCSGVGVTLTVSGGMGAPYNWYSSSTSTTIINTGTTYTVAPTTTTTYYVSSGTGICGSPRVPVTVTVSPAPAAPIISSNSPLCIGDALNLTSNTISGATYNWTGPNSFSSSLEDPSIGSVTSAMAGTYDLFVTVAGCPSATASTTVNINTNSTAPTGITGTTTICSGASTTLTLVGGSAGTGATAQWYTTSCGGTAAGTGNSITVSPTATTTYFVRYEGTCNTTTCASQVVTVNPLPSAPTSSVSPSAICPGGNAVLSATGCSGTLTWYTNSTGTGTPLASTTVSPATTTTYYAFCTQSGCRSATGGSVTLTVNSNPTVTVPNGGVVCDGETLNLTPTTGGTWTSSDNSIATITNGGVVTGVAPGTADMTFTETSTGCSSGASAATITVNPLPTFTVSTTDPTSCGATDGTITISGLDASTGYEVALGSGALTPETSNASGEIVITGLGAGSYSPIEVSLNGCSTIDNGTYDLNDPSSPTITVPNGGVVCEGETLNLTPSTGGTWSSSDNSIATITNGGVVTGQSGGTATVIFTETSTGCASLASDGLITVNASPTVTVPNGGVVCDGETLNLTPTTGGTWTSSDNSIATITNGGVVTGIAPGTADMTFTETSTGCSSGASAATITVNPLPTFTVSTTDPTSCGATDGTITISGLDASTGYEVALGSGALSPETSNASGEIVITGLGAGSYSPIEVSLNGCSTIDNGTYDLNDPSSPTITVPNGGELCVGDILNLTPTTGGTWTSSDNAIATIDNAGVLEGIAAGTVTVIYTETSSGCSSLASDGVITVNPTPTVTVPNGGEVCEGAELTLTPTTGGTWTSSDNSIATVTNGGVVTGVSAGTAEMTFTNTTTGCSSASADGTITVNASPTITVPVDNEICIGSTLSLSPSTGGTWSSNDATIATITNSGEVTGVFQGTTEMVFTDDASGCSSIVSDGTVIVNAPPTLTTGAIDCDEATSTFSVEYTASTGATVTSNLGDVNASSVSNVPNDQEVVITASIGGCPSTTTTVSTDDCDDIIIDISNGVSPNSDGLNDFFVITSLDAYPDNNLTIYNRWGDKVFQLAPYNNEWNGQNNVGGLGGEELPAGTYFYILELGDDEEPIKGYVELKR